MTDQLVRLTSTTSTTHDFTTDFSPALTFTDEDTWSVAIAEIYIPRVPRLATIRDRFNSGEQLASLRVFYDTVGNGSNTKSIIQAVYETVLADLGDNVTKADILQAIYADGMNKIIAAVKADSTVSKAYWHDSSGDAMYQKFVWEGDDLVLKASATGMDTYLRLSYKLFGLFSIIDSNLKMTKDVYPRASINYDFKDKVTWSLANNNTELYLYGNVDWVFVNLKNTPFNTTSLFPKQHVDVRSDVVSDTNKVFMHAVVPFGGITITPAIRDYQPLSGSSMSSIRVWITSAGTNISLSSALHEEKTHVVLHFKKEKQNLRGDYRREHPTMVF